LAIASLFRFTARATPDEAGMRAAVGRQQAGCGEEKIPGFLHCSSGFFFVDFVLLNKCSSGALSQVIFFSFSQMPLML
jgi:hypothetical protein